MSTATEMCLRDHNSNSCTHSGKPATFAVVRMVNNDKLYFGIELAHIICMEEPTDF